MTYAFIESTIEFEVSCPGAMPDVLYHIRVWRSETEAQRTYNTRDIIEKAHRLAANGLGATDIALGIAEQCERIATVQVRRIYDEGDPVPGVVVYKTWP
jgi:hypothetical protein